jgi:diadenylate cyclase
MAELSQTLQSFWQQLLSAVSTIGFADYIDWLLVAFLIYHAGLLVRETRAKQLVKGIAAILLVYWISIWLEMNALRFFLETIVRSGVLLLVVLFQPELRRALEQVGRSKLSGLGGIFGTGTDILRREQVEGLIKALRESCTRLSESRTGALVVFEREIKLGEIISSGTVIDAAVSDGLVTNIFFKNSPLHDGAMVVRNARIHAAGCYLPLSQNTEIARELGTRHRAALGMSENSDAVIIVVSEETGAISAAYESRLVRNLSPQALHDLLREKLLPRDAEKKPASRRAGHEE